MRRICIGTRGSALALAQSNWVKEQLERHDPNIAVDLRVIKTRGDRFLETPIRDLGNKGAFTREIDEVLLRGEIDLAVHSMKDLPAKLPADLVIAAVPRREDPRDVVVTRSRSGLAALEPGTAVGTGSLRRRAQLLHYRGDLSIVSIRGNVDSRLRKLDDGEVGALVMAAAGLKRIGRADRIGEFLTEEICVSAVAQGALAVEARIENPVIKRLEFLHDAVACAEVTAERAMLGRLGGGCHVPIGARSRVREGRLEIVGVVASADGRRLCRAHTAGSVDDAEEIGLRLANELLSQGADRLLAEAAS